MEFSIYIYRFIYRLIPDSNRLIPKALFFKSSWVK